MEVLQKLLVNGGEVALHGGEVGSKIVFLIKETARDHVTSGRQIQRARNLVGIRQDTCVVEIADDLLSRSRTGMKTIAVKMIDMMMQNNFIPKPDEKLLEQALKTAIDSVS